MLRTTWQRNQEKWLSNPHIYRIVVYLITKGPRRIACWLAESVQHLWQHEEGGYCLPCAAKERIRFEQHTETDGPCDIYCRKCGLTKSFWPKYCANRVVKVNNPYRRRRSGIFVLWG